MPDHGWFLCLLVSSWSLTQFYKFYKPSTTLMQRSLRWLALWRWSSGPRGESHVTGILTIRFDPKPRAARRAVVMQKQVSSFLGAGPLQVKEEAQDMAECQF